MDTVDLSTLLQLLADPTRRSALALLRGGRELCVCELMATLSATQSRMSRHMAALKDAGLVIDRRDAQWVRYRIASDLDPCVASVVDAVLAETTPPVLRRPRASKAAEPSRASRRPRARPTL